MPTTDAPAAPIDLAAPETWEGKDFLDLAEAGLRGDPAPEPPAVDPAPPTPAGVLTRDGQYIIPYRELEETRARLAEEKAQREALDARLQALETPAAPVAVAHETPAQWEGRAAVLAKVEAAVADGDTDLAEALRLGLAAKDQAAVLEDRMARLESGTAGLVERNQAAEIAERDAAFQANPLLVAIYAQAQAGQPGLWNAARALRATWENDPQYLALSWPERFAADAQAFREQFGLTDPAAPDAAPPAERPAPVPGVPPSLSHIPGGEVRQPPVRSAQDLEGLPQRQQTQEMMALYGQGKLFDFFDAFPVGSLNTGDPRQ